MDSANLDRYYKSQDFNWNTLIYKYLLLDQYFRTWLHLGPNCGAMTALTCILLVLVLACTVASWNSFIVCSRKFARACDQIEKKIPRRGSVLQVKPAYNCISKHLQQAGVFLDKTKKVVAKEQLEVEIINSRINSMSELLSAKDYGGGSTEQQDPPPAEPSKEMHKNITTILSRYNASLLL